MKNGSGRFIGGFYGLAPFEKHSDVAPLMKLAFSHGQGDPLPKLKQYLANYGIDQKFIKRKQEQGRGMEIVPGQGN